VGRRFLNSVNGTNKLRAAYEIWALIGERFRAARLGKRGQGPACSVWKNLGEDRLPSLEAARKSLDRQRAARWQNYVKVRDGIKKRRTVSVAEGARDRSAQIAPGEPLGITVEKADLIGRVEWAMMHGGRDITARKSIEWGEIQHDEKGNRTIRYKYYATIWDKDIYIMNQVFTLPLGPQPRLGLAAVSRLD
jgi:hypothetical protein